MYKSTDAGKTWTHLGLRDSQQIGQVVVDPKDANRVFVAALGHPYGPNTERGIFRSTDGGKSFERVLYKDENTGGTDVLLDPSNPNIVYAALWQARQGPWENGDFRGPGSGLFKSTDGGTTWRQLTGGLPNFEADRLGRIGIGIAPSRPSRLFAIVEARNSGRLPIGRCGRDVDARQQRSARAGTAERCDRRARASDQSRHRDRADDRDVEIHRRRPHVHRDSRRAGRRRLSARVVQSRTIPTSSR